MRIGTPLALIGLLGMSMLVTTCIAGSAIATSDTAMQIADAKSFGNGQGWASDGVHLVRTEDDGRHWQDITPASVMGIQQVFFANPQEGWVAGVDQSGALALFSTDDGGATWFAQPPIAPAPAGAHVVSMHFADARHGWLMLQLPSSSNFSFGRLLASKDGGAHWHRLPKPPMAGDIRFATASDGRLWGDSEHPGFYRSHDGGQIWLRAEQTEAMAVDQAAFASALPEGVLGENESLLDVQLHGDGSAWLLVGGGVCREFKSQCSQHTRLLVLDAAGQLRDITPRSLLAGQPSHLVELSINNEGFDKCAAATASHTNAWWPNTPWSWVNIYIGGENRGCSQVHLDSAWVDSVLATGFTLVPTWVGPQAPGSICGGCSIHSSNVATARQQGIAEANAASAAASALGLYPPTIVYYDMERYDPAYQDAVHAFIDGWVQGMHAHGNQAGVYGSPYNIKFYAEIGHPPDAVWLASWNGDPGVFGITGISDALWANHQRLHQYLGGHNETWNGVTFNIDSNGSDGPVAAGGCFVAEPILGKYNAMGGAGGILGPCTTNTNPTADGGVYNHFQNGSIYHSAATGTHEIHGAISDKWNSLQWELGPLGYPISDETATADGIGRFNHFEGGAIYWTSATNAHAVYGAIFDLWETRGLEASCLGYPTSDEYDDGSLRRSDFQRGYINWSSTQGAIAHCSDRIFADGFGVSSAP